MRVPGLHGPGRVRYTATMEGLSERIILLIRSIPRGRVASYGQVAALAGAVNGARQVARLLHSSSEKRGLPWHRVLNAQGRISLPPGGGFELQKKLLEAEGVRFEGGTVARPGGGTVARPGEGRVDLSKYGWRPVLDRLP